MTFAWSVAPNYSRTACDAGRLAYNNPDRYDPSPIELWGAPDWVPEGLKRHNAVVRTLARDRGVPLIDQESLIGKDLHSFSDVCHLSDPGTDRFVAHIAEAMASLRAR